MKKVTNMTVIGKNFALVMITAAMVILGTTGQASAAKAEAEATDEEVAGMVQARKALKRIAREDNVQYVALTNAWDGEYSTKSFGDAGKQMEAKNWLQENLNLTPEVTEAAFGYLQKAARNISITDNRKLFSTDAFDVESAGRTFDITE